MNLVHQFTGGYGMDTGIPGGYIFSLALDLHWVLVMCLIAYHLSVVPMGLGIVACPPTDKSVGYIECPYGTWICGFFQHR